MTRGRRRAADKEFFVDLMMTEELSLPVPSDDDGMDSLKDGAIMFIAFALFGMLPLVGFVFTGVLFPDLSTGRRAPPMAAPSRARVRRARARVCVCVSACARLRVCASARLRVCASVRMCVCARARFVCAWCACVARESGMWARPAGGDETSHPCARSLFCVACFITAAALFGLGAFKAKFHDKAYVRSGVETTLLGGVCAAVAYFVGRAVSHVAVASELFAQPQMQAPLLQQATAAWMPGGAAL